MPWVRIDENAMDHPKFLALSDGAWRLWCEGLSYCQKHLTDGVLEVSALRGFRYYSPAKMKALLTPRQEGAQALWRQLDADTIHVHDYLDWNDSRADVLLARQQAQERRRRYRDKRAAGDASQDADRTRPETPTVVCGVSYVGSSESSNQQKTFPRTREADPAEAERAALGERAGRFVETYQDLHEKYRHIAYLGNPQSDYHEALLLAKVYTDEQLYKFAVVFLNAEDDFLNASTRTIAKFRSRATWCAERLRQRGIA